MMQLELFYALEILSQSHSISSRLRIKMQLFSEAHASIHFTSSFICVISTLAFVCASSCFCGFDDRRHLKLLHFNLAAERRRECALNRTLCTIAQRKAIKVFHFPYCTYLLEPMCVYCFGNGTNLSLFASNAIMPSSSLVSSPLACLHPSKIKQRAERLRQKIDLNSTLIAIGIWKCYLDASIAATRNVVDIFHLSEPLVRWWCFERVDERRTPGSAERSNREM